MRVVFSIGSNLGDRLARLQSAVDALHACAVSPVVETDPVGGPEQPDYLNAVCIAEVAGDPLELAQRAEAEAGRTREVRWGPRSLDVDVVDVAGLISSDPRLTLPHPRAHERAFVLVPWLALDAQAQLPGHGRVADLLAHLDASGVRWRPDLTLELPT